MGGPVGYVRRRRPGAGIARLILLTFPLAAARASEPPAEGYPPSILDSFERLSEHMDDAGWERQSEFITRSIDNLWKRNGWTTEADRFARDAACEVTAIPPWRVMKRLNTINARLTQRYGLSEAQASQFQGAIIRETSGILMRNLGVITKQIQEVMQTRSEGKPFTAEQVARWMEEGRPIMIGMRESVDRVMQTLRPMLGPDKLETFDADLESYEKRQRVVDQAAERWARGQWQPSDWGLEDDPLHRNASLENVPKADMANRAARPESKNSRPAKLAKCVAHDPETWYACVLELKEQFKLDPGQQDTAESIRAELVERARAYVKSRAATLQKVPVTERKTHEVFEPVFTLFSEFKSRLEAIPTTSQREEGERRDKGGR